MNIIQGLNIEGFELDTAENFNSIPGIKGWYDARFRKTIVNTDDLSLWGDLSPIGNNLAAASAQRYLKEIGGFKIRSTVTGGTIRQLISLRRDFTFLHNGSPFGIYCICKPDINTTLSNAFILLQTTPGVGGVGVQFFIESGGRVTYAIFNETIQASSCRTNNIAAGRLTFDVIQSIGVTYNGTTVNTASNWNLWRDNFSMTKSASSSGPLSNNNHTVFIGPYANFTDNVLDIYTLLIYDWTGKTPFEVAQYDTAIRSILSNLKSTFETLEL
jgi:hypothetical protein